MRRRPLRWIGVGCLVVVVAGVVVGYFLMSNITESLRPLPATQILRSTVGVSSASGKPLPSPQTIFEAADSAFTSMERLNVRLDIHEKLPPMFVMFMTATRAFKSDISDFPSINASIQTEWHIDFRKKFVLFRRVHDDITKQTPYEFRHRISSDSIKEAAYDGSRWVFIHDEHYYHPNYPPERGWRYHVVLLGSYEEGQKILGHRTEDLLALFGLHRAYLFAKNNMRSLIEVNRMLSSSGIPEGWELSTEGVDRIGHYYCYRVKAINRKRQATVWLWFCPDLQYRCIRAEYTERGVAKIIDQGDQITPANTAVVAEIPEWTKGEFTVPMPKKIKTAIYFPASPSESEYILLQQREIAVQYLPPVEDSAFRLPIPTESTYVSDNIANRVYTLGKEVPIAPRRSHSWLYGMLSGLLLVSVGVGVYFYRRRRKALNG